MDAVEGRITEARLAYGGAAPFTVLAITSTLSKGVKVSSLIEECGILLNLLDSELKLLSSVPGGMIVFRESLILSFFYEFAQSLLQSVEFKHDETALSEVTRTYRPVGICDLRN